MYEIKQAIITGLPQIPFTSGVGQYECVVAHGTDSNNHSGGDTPTGERNYEANTFNSAFVHFFVGVENGQAVALQSAPTDYMAYGAGPGINHRAVHVELCMYDDPATFKMAYDAYVWLLGYLLFNRSLGVSKAKADGSGTLWSHADVTRFYPGTTTHQDPIEYLQAHGISWDQCVNDVTYIYNCLAQPPKDYEGHWAEDDIKEVMKDGLMSGYPDGSFKPDQPVTRAELAAVLTRLK